MSERATRVQAIRWAAGAYVLFTAACGFYLWATLVPIAGPTVLVDVLVYEVPMFVALIACSYLTLTIRGSVEHRMWGLFAAAIGFLLPAEVYWTWYSVVVDPSGPAVPHIMLLAYVGALACFYLVVVRMTTYASRPWHERHRFLFDILGIVAATVPTIYVVWTLPMISGIPGATEADAFVMAAYPVVALLIALGGVSITVGWKAHRWARWEQALAGFFALYATGLALYPLWATIHLRDGTQPAWYALILGTAWAMLAFSAVLRATERGSDEIFEPWPTPDILPWWFGRVFPLALAGALPVLAIAMLRAEKPSDAEPILYAAIALGLVLAARSVVVSVGQANYAAAAATDPESGALTRTQFGTSLQSHTRRAVDNGTNLELLVLGVTDLRRGEGSLGRGSRPFVAASARVLRETTGINDVYDAGPGRLAVLIEGSTPGDVASVGRRAWLALVREAESIPRPLDVAIGIAGVPMHATNAAGLLAAADAALALARVAETEPVVVYEPDAASVSTEQAEQAARLRAVRAAARQLAEAVDARDPHTSEHSVAVSELATPLAQVVGLSDDEVQLIGVAALVHDVGKVGVRDVVLTTERPLTAEERAEVEEHPVLGEHILEPARIEGLGPIVRHHHERWDGDGYPDGLVGEEIPLGARVLAVCDAFVSLTTPRSYRGAADRESALVEIEECGGTQFDPEIAATFVRMVRTLGGGHAPHVEGMWSPTLNQRV